MSKRSEPVVLPQAILPGRKYEEDKPRDCRYCYYWGGRFKGCLNKDCWYLIPLPAKPKFTLNTGVLSELNCKTCAYGKITPCIGYCIAKIEREVFSKTRGWKLPEEKATDGGIITPSIVSPEHACGVLV